MNLKHIFLSLNEGVEPGFVTDIEKDTVENTNYRKVLFTTELTQLVIMSLKPGEEIGEEVHDGDQFFRFDAGEGEIVMNGKAQIVEDGDAAVVPSGVKHNVINTSETEDLKLYAIYSPPQHEDGTVNKTKEEAEG